MMNVVHPIRGGLPIIQTLYRWMRVLFLSSSRNFIFFQQSLYFTGSGQYQGHMQGQNPGVIISTLTCSVPRVSRYLRMSYITTSSAYSAIRFISPLPSTAQTHQSMPELLVSSAYSRLPLRMKTWHRKAIRQTPSFRSPNIGSSYSPSWYQRQQTLLSLCGLLTLLHYHCGEFHLQPLHPLAVNTFKKAEGGVIPKRTQQLQCSNFPYSSRKGKRVSLIAATVRPQSIYEQPQLYMLAEGEQAIFQKQKEEYFL